MFVLQPIFGKIVLPLLGGLPSVWNTCMVCYQPVLFLGYLYAHLNATRRPPCRQITAERGHPLHIHTRPGCLSRQDALNVRLTWKNPAVRKCKT
jgi:hypothetical protein